MLGSAQQSPCANHPDRSAVGACGYCGKPVCQLCSMEFVATEQTFCSVHCRDALPLGDGQEPASNATLEAGLKKPIRGGWALWARSSGRIAKQVSPIAVVVAVMLTYMNWSVERPTLAPSGSTILILSFLIICCAAFSVALVGVILSARHAGLVEGTHYNVTARRLIPWMVTWALMIGITTAGYIALIIPGIYLGLRFFWADEFALIHNKSPIAALRASWDLTRGQAGTVFMFQFILGWAQYVVLIPVIILTVGLSVGFEALGWATEAFSGVIIFILFLVGLVTYGAMHGPEIVQFYGMRAAKIKQEATLDPTKERRTSDWLFTTVILLVAVIGLGIVSAMIIPSVFIGIDQGDQWQTYSDSYTIAVAMESYYDVHNQYPEVGSITELERLIVPEYLEELPVEDGWRRPFQVASTPTAYEIRSAGKDGVFEVLPPRGATSDVNDDIVWRDGELVQWPDHLEFE